MRELILKRIEEIKEKENGFVSLMKWKGTITVDISKFDFNTCNDVELLILFERILRRYFKQLKTYVL